MEHLSSFIADCDRKTELAKRRLKETQEELSEEANGKVSEGYIHVNQIFEWNLLECTVKCGVNLNIKI